MLKNSQIVVIGTYGYDATPLLLQAKKSLISYGDEVYIFSTHKALYSLIAYFCGGYPCYLKWDYYYRQAYKVSNKMVLHFLWLTRILYPKTEDEIYTIKLPDDLEDIPF